jgi:hypothetical protein
MCRQGSDVSRDLELVQDFFSDCELQTNAPYHLVTPTLQKVSHIA